MTEMEQKALEILARIAKKLDPADFPRGASSKTATTVSTTRKPTYPAIVLSTIAGRPPHVRLRLTGSSQTVQPTPPTSATIA